MQVRFYINYFDFRGFIVIDLMFWLCLRCQWDSVNLIFWSYHICEHFRSGMHNSKLCVFCTLNFIKYAQNTCTVICWDLSVYFLHVLPVEISYSYLYYSDLTTVMTFSERTETPNLQLSLLGELLLKKNKHELPWFQHVLLDLVIVVNAFLSSESYWQQGVTDPVWVYYFMLHMYYTNIHSCWTEKRRMGVLHPEIVENETVNQSGIGYSECSFGWLVVK